LAIANGKLKPKYFSLKGKHVVITGGSSGIGKEIAREAITQGAKVTIIARSKKMIDETVEEIAQLKYGEFISGFSCDISKDFKEVELVFEEIVKANGQIDALINCAGTSISGKFEETEMSEFSRMLQVNFIGTVNCTRAVVTSMKNENISKNKTSRIVFVSSQAGQAGIFGYTAYSPSKFALRGFAESLQMEMKPFNIICSVAFPPDTDTPGFKEENICKPKETKEISASSGLFQPQEVAKKVIKEMCSGEFFISFGIDGFMLSNLTCGMSPVHSLFSAVSQIFTAGLFRFISLFYLFSFDNIVKKHA